MSATLSVHKYLDDNTASQSIYTMNCESETLARMMAITFSKENPEIVLVFNIITKYSNVCVKYKYSDQRDCLNNYGVPELRHDMSVVNKKLKPDDAPPRRSCNDNSNYNDNSCNNGYDRDGYSCMSRRYMPWENPPGYWRTHHGEFVPLRSRF